MRDKLSADNFPLPVVHFQIIFITQQSATTQAFFRCNLDHLQPFRWCIHKIMCRLVGRVIAIEHLNHLGTFTLTGNFEKTFDIID